MALSNALAAVDTAFSLIKFTSKNFVITRLKLKSNIRAVTVYIYCIPVVTTVQHETKRGSGYLFSQFFKELVSCAVDNSSFFVLLQVKFLSARLSEDSFLVKGSKWFMILKKVLCCMASIEDLTTSNPKIARYWRNILFLCT